MMTTEVAVKWLDACESEVIWILQHDQKPGWEDRLKVATRERWQAIIWLARVATIVYSPPKGRS